MTRTPAGSFWMRHEDGGVVRCSIVRLKGPATMRPARSAGRSVPTPGRQDFVDMPIDMKPPTSSSLTATCRAG